jgi:hypothetical protein
MNKYKYIKDDPGFLRVYYKLVGTGRWFCIQNNGGWGKDKFEFCPCTSDGEPEFEVAMPPEDAFDHFILPKSIEGGKIGQD